MASKCGVVVGSLHMFYSHIQLLLFSPPMPAIYNICEKGYLSKPPVSPRTRRKTFATGRRQHMKSSATHGERCGIRVIRYPAPFPRGIEAVRVSVCMWGADTGPNMEGFQKCGRNVTEQTRISAGFSSCMPDRSIVPSARSGRQSK